MEKSGVEFRVNAYTTGYQSNPHVAATDTGKFVVVAAGPAGADCGLKSLGMDHGNPTIEDAEVWLCSDEHVTFAPKTRLAVGDRVRVFPAHVDPTVAYHERIFLCSGGEVTDVWDVDLRGW